MNWYTCIIIILLLCGCNPKRESTPSKILELQVDSLFEEWDQPDSPGAAVAIIKNGELIFEKGYGMASIEHQVPITPEKVFGCASVSKQFTAYCIALLSERGKVNLDEDIHRYLPSLPDYGTPVTVRQLLHHTSGLRDQWQLLQISGTRFTDIITQDHVLKVINAVTDLNFKPGDRHLYSNSGYTLLSEIVREVSGMSLREFAHKEIFDPLQMRHTLFKDDLEEIIPNSVNGYKSGKTSHLRHESKIESIGATGLFSTASDLAKWLEFMQQEIETESPVFKLMLTPAILNSGDSVRYSFGLGYTNLNGNRLVGHGGGSSGVRSFTGVIPAKQLGIVILSNSSNLDAQRKTEELTELLLPDKKEEKLSDEPGIYELYAGKYISEEGVMISLVDQRGFYLHYMGDSTQLFQASDSTFHSSTGDIKLVFRTNKAYELEATFRDERQEMIRYIPIDPAEVQFEEYTGTYRNETLNAQYRVNVLGDSLVLEHLKYPTVKLEPLQKDQFYSPHGWMMNIIFKRDKRGEVMGFEIHDFRVLHLYLEKV